MVILQFVKRVETKNTLKSGLKKCAELSAECRLIYRFNPPVFMHFSNIPTSFLEAVHFY